MDTKERPIACDFCTRTFSCISALKVHLVAHTKEKPFSCDVCSKAFSQRSNLMAHLLSHTKERPHECGICNKAFSRPYDLKRHLATHTKEKPFACTFCSKTFSWLRQLKIHLRTHTKEKPVACCGTLLNDVISKRYLVMRTATESLHLSGKSETVLGRTNLDCNIRNNFYGILHHEIENDDYPTEKILKFEKCF
ncbi:unnamed protein product [Larinioides sclopetarius]|uniref:C2H2-type domain-containing protein n=1 Tax=Larinioides sclopetarius TaxID=280406 RepID=A0AAV2AN69_9ARAC